MHSCRANTQPWPTSGGVGCDPLPKTSQLNHLRLYQSSWTCWSLQAPPNWTIPFWSKRRKPPNCTWSSCSQSSQCQKTILFTYQPYVNLCLAWSGTSGFEKEHDKQTSDVHWWIFTIWRKNILVLASVICLPGNFQFNLKQSTDQKGWHRHRETHTVLLTSFIFFLPPFCSSVNLFSYWRESVDRRCACEDEKRVSKVQKMLFKVIVHLI